MPLDAEGRRQIVVVVRDVTARRRAEAERERLLARAALLAEATELFDRSLDEELTMRRVARLCVRDIADTCVMVLGDRRFVAVARDRAHEATLNATLGGERGDEALTDLLRPSSLVTATPAGLGTARSVIVPLRARGRAHGVLAAGFDDPPAAATRTRSRCSRTWPAAPRSRSTTRGSTRSATRSRARSSAPGSSDCNDRFAAISGVPAAAHAGRTIAELLPEMAAMQEEGGPSSRRGGEFRSRPARRRRRSRRARSRRRGRP